MPANQDNQELPDTTGQQIARQKEQELEEQRLQTDILGELLNHVEKGDHYIPWEKVTLPSKGVYYGGALPGGVLEVKPMGVDVDKMLTNQRLIQSGSLLNNIIEACTKMPPDFSVNKMLAGDWNFLLYYLRGITHGNEYEFTSECPHCKTKNIFNFDLNELQSTIKWADEKYPVEPMGVVLPKISQTFGKEVTALVRLVRVSDINKMAKGNSNEVLDPVRSGRARVRNRNRRKQTQIRNEQQDMQQVYDDNMKTQIVGIEIDGQQFKDDRRFQIIDNLHQKDSAAISAFIDEIAPGIDTSIEVTCQNPECAQDLSISLPWSEAFFRPDN